MSCVRKIKRQLQTGSVTFSFNSDKIYVSTFRLFSIDVISHDTRSKIESGREFNVFAPFALNDFPTLKDFSLVNVFTHSQRKQKSEGKRKSLARIINP